MKVEEGGYPYGINDIFYKLFDQNFSAFSEGNYSHFFWMEHDVVPLRSYWLDLVKNDLHHEFMVQGGVHYRAGNPVNENSPTEDLLWLGHINGNAIYNTGSGCLLEIISRSKNSIAAFDVAIHQQLYAFVYTTLEADFRLFQRCIHLYHYS